MRWVIFSIEKPAKNVWYNTTLLHILKFPCYMSPFLSRRAIYYALLRSILHKRSDQEWSSNSKVWQRAPFTAVGTLKHHDSFILIIVCKSHCSRLKSPSCYQWEMKFLIKVDFTKSLGVLILDKNLNWEKHVEEKCKKISSGIGTQKWVRSLISQNTAIEIYKALIEPHFDYCSPVWYGISSNLTNKLQKLQNHTTRIISKSDFKTRSATLRQLLEWDDLSTRRSKHLGVAMFKTQNICSLFPSYLKGLPLCNHWPKIRIKESRK